MFFDRPDAVPIRSQRVPQSIETPVTFVSAPGIYLRFAYSRSSDSMASGIEGQDYLRFQHNDQKLVFVVCDGVGSSFCGNLAARILGDGLLEWLWPADVTYLGGAAALAEASASALNKLQRQTKHEVEEYEIPGHISPLVRQALEAQRAYGSEAVFAAIRVDHPSPTIPEGLISLCWMGDTQVHLFGEDGGEIEIGGRWENANRWSTTQGVRGQMGAWMRELAGVGRITAFTDGLNAHAKTLFDYSDDRLDREIHGGSRLPTSDDVALIDAVIRSAAYDGYPDPDLPDPNLERPQLEPIWNPTGGDGYELRWNWAGEKNASFMIQEATHPALSDATVMNVIAKETVWRPDKPQKPGHYYYRVRAINRRGVVTPWSELRQTRVAYPPPPPPRLEADASGSTPILIWEGEGDSLDYVLHESAADEFDAPKAVYTGRGTSWTAPPGYAPGVYFYRVQAISDGGAGSWSDTLRVKVTLPPPPKPQLTITGLNLVGSDSAYDLRWQPSPGASRYEVEETQADQPPRIIRLEDTSLRLTGQPPGEYVYRLRACHDHGCSEWSGEQTVTIREKPPSEAPVLTASLPNDQGVISLSWNAISGASQYEIEMAEDEEFDSASISETPELTFSLTRREPGVLFARARAANNGGEGPWSLPVQLGIAPPAPAWIETLVSADGRRIGAQWAAVGGKAVYCLEMGGEAGYREVYRGSDTRADIDMGGQAGMVSLRVRAEVGEAVSAWQTADPVKIGPSLTAPVLAPAQVGGDEEAHLQWSEVNGAERYVLEISRNEHFGSLQRLEGTAASVTFHPPSSGRYWFRVRAIQGAEVGPPSNITSIEAQRPTAPSLWPLDPVKAHTPFEIAWTGVPGGVYYDLQGSTSDRFEPDKTGSTRINHPSQKFTVPGRSPGTYYYRVRAVDAHEQPSLWSNVMMVEVRDE